MRDSFSVFEAQTFQFRLLMICWFPPFSSLEPDAKRQRADDGSAVAANSMTDMQANNSAYNYNWYQVGCHLCVAVQMLMLIFRVKLYSLCPLQHYGAWGQNSWGQYGQYNQYNQYYPPPPT